MPGTAVLPALIDNEAVVPPVAIVPGVNTAVTPTGGASTDSATSPTNVPTRAMVTVLVTDAPTVADNVGEPTASVIAGIGDTTTVMVVVRSVCPAVPRTVRLYVPGTVAAVVLTVSVDVPAVAGFGANTPLTPAGAPSSDNCTLAAKPPVRVTVTALVPDCPAVIGNDAGVAVSE